MLKAVIDTNLFLSGLLNATGAPAKLTLRWLSGQFDILSSKEIIEEYSYVLRNSPSVDQSKATELLNKLSSSGINVEIPGALRECKDPDDNKFLETATVGKADYLVTKNTKHFPKKSYQDVRIVKVSKFLAVLEKQSSEQS